MQRCKLHQSWKRMVFETKENLQLSKTQHPKLQNISYDINYYCFEIFSNKTNLERKKKVWFYLDEGEESPHSQLRLVILLNLVMPPFLWQCVPPVAQKHGVPKGPSFMQQIQAYQIFSKQDS